MDLPEKRRKTDDDTGNVDPALQLHPRSPRVVVDKISLPHDVLERLRRISRLAKQRVLEGIGDEKKEGPEIDESEEKEMELGNNAVEQNGQLREDTENQENTSEVVQMGNDVGRKRKLDEVLDEGPDEKAVSKVAKVDDVDVIVITDASPVNDERNAETQKDPVPQTESTNNVDSTDSGEGISPEENEDNQESLHVGIYQLLRNVIEKRAEVFEKAVTKETEKLRQKIELLEDENRNLHKSSLALKGALELQLTKARRTRISRGTQVNANVIRTAVSDLSSNSSPGATRNRMSANTGSAIPSSPNQSWSPTALTLSSAAKGPQHVYLTNSRSPEKRPESLVDVSVPQPQRSTIEKVSSTALSTHSQTKSVTSAPPQLVRSYSRDQSPKSTVSTSSVSIPTARISNQQTAQLVEQRYTTKAHSLPRSNEKPGMGHFKIGGHVPGRTYLDTSMDKDKMSSAHYRMTATGLQEAGSKDVQLRAITKQFEQQQTRINQPPSTLGRGNVSTAQPTSRPQTLPSPLQKSSPKLSGDLTAKSVSGQQSMRPVDSYLANGRRPDVNAIRSENLSRTQQQQQSALARMEKSTVPNPPPVLFVPDSDSSKSPSPTHRIESRSEPQRSPQERLPNATIVRDERRPSVEQVRAVEAPARPQPTAVVQGLHQSSSRPPVPAGQQLPSYTQSQRHPSPQRKDVSPHGQPRPHPGIINIQHQRYPTNSIQQQPPQGERQHAPRFIYTQQRASRPEQIQHPMANSQTQRSTISYGANRPPGPMSSQQLLQQQQHQQQLRIQQEQQRIQEQQRLQLQAHHNRPIPSYQDPRRLPNAPPEPPSIVISDPRMAHPGAGHQITSPGHIRPPHQISPVGQNPRPTLIGNTRSARESPTVVYQPGALETRQQGPRGMGVVERFRAPHENTVYQQNAPQILKQQPPPHNMSQHMQLPPGVRHGVQGHPQMVGHPVSVRQQPHPEEARNPSVPSPQARPPPLQQATPAPAPRTTALLPPPKPSASIAVVQNGIVLSWNMRIDDSHEKIDNYELFACQDGSESTIPTIRWKKIGVVKALPLPMACTLTQFSSGSRYQFAVRAVDILDRGGNFSDPCVITLKK